MKNVINVAFVAAFVMVFSVRMFNVEKSTTLSEIALANVIALAADDDSTEICVKLVSCECGEFTESPSGDSYHVWLDMINKTF